MTAKEQTRLQILNGVLEGHWFVREAAEVLGVSERHAWRLLAAYRKEGAAALAHGNRGRVPQGHFLLLRGVIQRHGIPLAVYTDRHAVFQHWRHWTEEISASLGTGKPTQCGRALREMGVTQIFAHSPEAKGRVERANGTFQSLP